MAVEGEGKEGTVGARTGAASEVEADLGVMTEVAGRVVGIEETVAAKAAEGAQVADVVGPGAASSQLLEKEEEVMGPLVMVMSAAVESSHL